MVWCFDTILNIDIMVSEVRVDANAVSPMAGHGICDFVGCTAILFETVVDVVWELTLVENG